MSHRCAGRKWRPCWPPRVRLDVSRTPPARVLGADRSPAPPVHTRLTPAPPLCRPATSGSKLAIIPGGEVEEESRSLVTQSSIDQQLEMIDQLVEEVAAQNSTKLHLLSTSRALKAAGSGSGSTGNLDDQEGSSNTSSQENLGVWEDIASESESDSDQETPTGMYSDLLSILPPFPRFSSSSFLLHSCWHIHIVHVFVFSPQCVMVTPRTRCFWRIGSKNSSKG